MQPNPSRRLPELVLKKVRFRLLGRAETPTSTLSESQIGTTNPKFVRARPRGVKSSIFEEY